MPFDHGHNDGGGARPKNVLGGVLHDCSHAPLTGFYRDGCCHTGPDDRGVHTVCAVMTDEFLRFTADRGNDLSTPRPEYNFPGLNPGDRWCLCASRWMEAYQAGCAPGVILSATHVRTLQIVPLPALKSLSCDVA